jgi:hypothetical protein
MGITMARPARSGLTVKAIKPPVEIIDERPISKILPRSGEIGDNTKPIRTVLYVEVQDLPAQDVAAVCKNILGGLNNGHPHYICLMRFGKITTDFEFEGEFLNTVNRLCEVLDGTIVLKNGAIEVDVIRRII